MTIEDWKASAVPLIDSSSSPHNIADLINILVADITPAEMTARLNSYFGFNRQSPYGYWTDNRDGDYLTIFVDQNDDYINIGYGTQNLSNNLEPQVGEEVPLNVGDELVIIDPDTNTEYLRIPVIEKTNKILNIQYKTFDWDWEHQKYRDLPDYEEEIIVTNTLTYQTTLARIDFADGTSSGEFPLYVYGQDITSGDEQIVWVSLSPIIKVNPNWTPSEGELPVFKNSYKDGSISVTKLTENAEHADPNQKFKFKIKLIGDGASDFNVNYEFEQSSSEYIALTYDANGGVFNNNETQTENDMIYTLQDDSYVFLNGDYLEPSREGHTFAGWYEDQDFTTEWVIGTIPSADKTVYAKWNPNTMP